MMNSATMASCANGTLLVNGFFNRFGEPNILHLDFATFQSHS